MPSHEPELYKDKIEVSLDGRQIFYLFFGGAVIVGLVFVLGVLVGRRVEARGHLDRADTQAAADPLAALDRLERPDHLSFRGALTGSEAPTDVEKAIGEIEKRRLASPGDRREAGKAEAGKAAASPAVKGEATRTEDHAAEARTEPATRPDADRPRAEHDGDKRDGKRDDGKRDGDKKPKKHDVDTGHAEARRPARDEEPVPRPETHGDVRSEPRAESAKVRFTLQLSSFQDRSEAEAFLGAIKAAGFEPYLTEAEVTGKGTFYRVRLGSYRSLEAANDAKAEFEKTARKAAQIMRL